MNNAASRITLSWNPDRLEETKVSFSPQYQQLHRIEKLDFLKDAIWDLERAYEALLNDVGAV